MIEKGYSKYQVPKCIIKLEDDRNEVPIAFMNIKSDSIIHWARGDAISFYVDLCRSMLRILLIIMSVLPWCSWATPTFLKNRGHKIELASVFYLLYIVILALNNT